MLPEEVTGRELPSDVLDALRTLGDLGTTVARHLVMVGELLDLEPEQAWKHAEFALHLAARVGVVREIAGTAAYRVGKYDVALRELRAAKRLTGALDYLPLMADAERGLGRPEKALELVTGDDATALDAAGRLELLIVGAGAHLDLGRADEARALLEVGELDVPPKAGSPLARQARARLFYAYAEALDADGDPASHSWLVKAAEADVDGSTGAAQRLGLDDNDYEVFDLADFPADESRTDTPASDPSLRPGADDTPDDAGRAAAESVLKDVPPVGPSDPVPDPGEADAGDDGASERATEERPQP